MPRLSKPKIPIREKLVALVGALTLAYTAWGFGGVIAWSLHIMLAGGLLTLTLSVFPLRFGRRKLEGRAQSSGKPQGNKATAPRPRQPLFRLFRFPGAWFAFAFLLYLAVAALNPSWQIVSDSRGWWLEAQEPPLSGVVTGFMPGSTQIDNSNSSSRGVNPLATTWLPTSVEASYEPMNAWRIFNMHLAAFSLALGLYLGLTCRRTTQSVLWSFLVSAALMASVAMIQKYTGADTVLWTYESQNPQFWGSFFYRNQGAAFLNWGIVIAGVLYFYHARRGREEARSGGPHFLAFCLIGLIAVSVGLALSRGGILFAAILIAIFLIFVLTDYVYHTVAQLSRHTLLITTTLTLTFTLLLSVGLFQANRAIDWQAIELRFGDIEATIDNADQDARMLSSKLTWKMAQDQLWTGWGAGSFRYAFPMYQQELPELFYQYHHRKKGWMGRKFYRYAHNDILQFLAEYGIVGCSLLILTILSFLAPTLKAAFHSPLPAFYLLLGCAVAVAHAFLDFIFHSPAYWIALIAGIALCGRLIQLNAQRRF